MDHCASILMAFPPDHLRADDVAGFEAALRTHMNRLENLFKDQSAAIGTNAVQLLNCLDPGYNTLSYMALLDTLVPVSIKPQDLDPLVADDIIVFLVSFDPRQVRFAGHIFSNLFSIVGSGQLVPASIAVEVLAKALMRVDPTGSILTSNHLTLARLAYQSNNIAAALPVVSKAIVYYPGMVNQKDPAMLSDPSLAPPLYISKNSGLTINLRPTMVLEYDLIAGLMHCSVRDWVSAREAFGRVASYPTRDSGLSRIMVEAHKKWLLVSLLQSGQTDAVPPHTSGNATKSFTILSKGYLQVAESFQRLDAEALKTEAEVSWPRFVEDGNEGLMIEVLAAHQKWQIACLRAVYTKISIADIRAKTKSAKTGEPLPADEDVETLLADMIGSNMLDARIVKRAADTTGSGASEPTYLEFLAPAAEMSETEYKRELEAAAERVVALRPIFRAANERLGTSKEYIRFALKEQLKEQDHPRESSGFEELVDDEDLMTGITPTI